MLRLRCRLLAGPDASWAPLRGGISTLGRSDERCDSRSPHRRRWRRMRCQLWHDEMGLSICPTSDATRDESRGSFARQLAGDDFASLLVDTQMELAIVPGSLVLCAVLPPSSVGEMTLRLYGALSYSQSSVRDLRFALNGA